MTDNNDSFNKKHKLFAPWSSRKKTWLRRQKQRFLEIIFGELREGCTIDVFKDWSPTFQAEVNQKGLDLRRVP